MSNSLHFYSFLLYKLNLGFPKTKLAILFLGAFLTTYVFIYCIWIHSVSQILPLYMDVPITTASLLNGLNLETPSLFFNCFPIRTYGCACVLSCSIVSNSLQPHGL